MSFKDKNEAVCFLYNKLNKTWKDECRVFTGDLDLDKDISKVKIGAGVDYNGKMMDLSVFLTEHGDAEPDTDIHFVVHHDDCIVKALRKIRDASDGDNYGVVLASTDLSVKEMVVGHGVSFLHLKR